MSSGHSRSGLRLDRQTVQTTLGSKCQPTKFTSIVLDDDGVAENALYAGAIGRADREFESVLLVNSDVVSDRIHLFFVQFEDFHRDGFDQPTVESIDENSQRNHRRL